MSTDSSSRLRSRRAGVALGLLGTTALATPALAQIDFFSDQLTSFIEGLVSSESQQVRIEGLSGVPFNVQIERIVIADDQGDWLTIDGVALDIAARALLRGRLEIASFGAQTVVVERAPNAPPDPAQAEQGGFSLPQLPQLPESVSRVVIEEVSFPNLVLEEPVLGERATFELSGSLTPVEGQDDALDLDLTLNRTDEDTARLTADARYGLSGTQTLDLDLALREDGKLVRRLSGLPDAGALDLTLQGQGPLEDWSGTLDFEIDDVARAAATLEGDFGDTPEVDLLANLYPVRGSLPAEVEELIGQRVAVDVRLGQPDPDVLRVESFDVESDFLQTSGQGVANFATGELDGQALVSLPSLARASGLAGTELGGTASLQIQASGSVQDPAFNVALNASDVAAQGFEVQSATARFDAELLAPLDATYAGMRVEGQGQVEGVLQDGQPLRPEDGLSFEVAATVPQEGQAELSRFSVNGDTFEVGGEARIALPSLEGQATLTASVPSLQEFTRALGDLAPPDLDPRGAVNLSLNADIGPNAESVTGTLDVSTEGLGGLPRDVTALIGNDPTITARVDYLQDERVTLESFDVSGAGFNAQGTADLALPGLAGTVDFDAELDDLAALEETLRAYGVPEGRTPSGRIELALDAEIAEGAARVDGDVSLRGRGLANLPADLTALIGADPTLNAAVDYVENQRVELADLNLDAAKVGLTGRAAVGLSEPQALDGRVALTLPDLSALEPVIDQPIAGSGEVVLDLGGTLRDLDVELAGDLASLQAGGREFEQVSLRATATGPTDEVSGGVTFEALQQGERVVLQGDYRYAPPEARLDNLTLTAPATELSGDVAYNLEGGTADGALQGRVDDFTALEPWIGQRLEGSADLDVAFNSQGGGQAASVTARVPRLSGDFGEVSGLTLDVDVADALGTPSVQATADLGGFEQGELDVAAAQIQASGSLADLDVTASLRGQQGEDLPFDVRTALNADLADSTNRRVTLSELAGDLAGEPLELRSPATVSLGEATALEGFDLAWGDAELDARGRYGEGVVDGSLTLAGFDLAQLDPFLPSDLEGTVTANVSASGSPSAPVFNVEAAGQNLRATDPQFANVPPADLALNGEYQDARFAADATLSNVFDEPLRVEASVPVLIDLNGGLAQGVYELREQDPLDGRIAGRASLERLISLAQLDGQFGRGELTLDFDLGGTLADPEVDGAAAIEDGRFVDAETGLTLNDLEVLLRANGRTLDVERLAATTPGNGEISGTGSLRVVPEENFPFEVNIASDRARLIDGDLGRAEVSSDLEISGDLVRAAVEGQVTVNRADLRIPDGGAVDPVVLDVTVKGESAPPPRPLDQEDGQAAQALAIDLNVGVEANRVFVRGRGLESEWGGGLTVRGTAAQPEIAGSIDFQRGFLDFLDRRFVITEGSVTFTGDTPPSPQVNLVAEAEGEEIVAVIRVSGPATSPELELSSEPEVPQDQILADLLFNRDVSEITPAQGIKLAFALRELEGGGPGALDRLRGTIGLDTLDVGGEGTDATVAAGKYLTDDVFLEVEQGLSTGETKARVEINLDRYVAKGVNAATEVGSDGNSGAEVGWTFDW